MSLPMSISKTAMKAFQTGMDNIANNIANVNTNSYKEKNVNFQELLINNQTENQNLLFSEDFGELTISAGVSSTVSGMDFSQGGLVESAGDFHLAISGDGFFRVNDENGNVFYTRDGAFQVGPNGVVKNSAGNTLAIEQNLLPTLDLSDANVSISDNGEIWVGSKGAATLAGRIPLFYPASADALVPAGENQYIVAEGTRMYSSAEGYQMGGIQQHFLETSNVDLAAAFTDMIVTQRAYSMNLKVAQTSDEIMGVINGFKR
ncbi:flagellar hook-basal body protein [Trichococcus collinsii]|uniref:Flagellar basal-body rod protein FlgG n=1 Tax=Trichococcus collinsii TaxID=157076 RepID=A0AB38A0J9_9LACT|nr:flagellar hook basal-body protein [Trichococcus collinsii]CZQ90358.1 flagella basal body rod protein [Trichococcus collinsii]SEA51381.1 flagellar basal-body rod protein FlgG [Trichococcus collinsii]